MLFGKGCSGIAGATSQLPQSPGAHCSNVYHFMIALVFRDRLAT